MAKKSVLTKEVLESYVEANKKAEAIKNQITDRIDHVLSVICEAFGKKRRGYWYFYDAPEGQIGTLRLPIDDDDFIDYVAEDFPLIKNYLCDYGDSFPKRFLFMTDEEIISFIREETSRGETEKMKKAEKAEARKKSSAEKKQAVLAKLTKEERKALGV